MSTVLILKGWVYGMDPDELNRCYQHLVERLRRGKYKLIIWDGDLDKKDSFTSLISRLMCDQEFKNLVYVAFKPYQWIRDLEKGYTELDHGISSFGYMIESEDSNYLYAKDVILSDNKETLGYIGLENNKLVDWAFLNNDGDIGYIPKKKLSVIGFDLGDGENIDWEKLSIKGLQFTMNQLKLKSATIMTIGEGNIWKREFEQYTMDPIIASLKIELIRLSTQRKVEGTIEYAPLT